MSRLRRNFAREFRDGAVRIVKETGRPVAHVARERSEHERTNNVFRSVDFIYPRTF